MLDECRGERLEDTLAVFSSAVLKKVVTERRLNSSDHSALAQHLALEQRGYANERAELNTLILAHKASLRSKLGCKEIARNQYGELAHALDQKEHAVLKRRERAKKASVQGHSVRISDEEKAAVRRAVRNNWTGNERWQEALIYGDANARRDGLLSTPFDRVWRRTRSNRLAELDNQSGGLLEQLDDRVRVQRERLDKWRIFRQELCGDAQDAIQGKGAQKLRSQRGIDLELSVHESLHLGRMSPRKLTIPKTRHTDGEYSDLLKQLESELERVNAVPAAPALGRLKGRVPTAHTPKQPISDDDAPEQPRAEEISDLDDEPNMLSRPASRPIGTASRQDLEDTIDADAAPGRPQRPSRPTLQQPLSTMAAYRLKPKSSEISPLDSTGTDLLAQTKEHSPRGSPIRYANNKSPSPMHSPTRSVPPSPSWSPPRRSPVQRTHSPEEILPSPTQQKADQILESMDAASPSPIKQSRPRHKLSLVERTRLSMSRGIGIDLDDEDELTIESPTNLGRRSASRSPVKKPSMSTISIPEDADLDGEPDHGNDLVARTRKSMANFEAAQQKARLERQRSLKREARQQKTGSIGRQTYFPAVEEDGQGEEDTTTAVLEDLMAREAEAGEGGVDYEAVFKSRPKIKTSPPSTPLRSAFE